MIITERLTREPPQQLVVIQSNRSVASNRWRNLLRSLTAAGAASAVRAARATVRSACTAVRAVASTSGRQRICARLAATAASANGLRAGAAPALACAFALAHAAFVLTTDLQRRADDAAASAAANESTLRSLAAAAAALPRVNIVTLVTAYWNVGEFEPTPYSAHRHPGLYRQWLLTFADILNPVVALFDEPSVAREFAEVRRGLPTKIVVVRKEQLWSFRLLPRVKRVLEAPDYPKRVPTMYAAYDCVQHAKYDAVEFALRDDHFHTEYVAWIDVGMFRDLVSATDRRQFAIEVPPTHRQHLVAYNQVFDFDPSATVSGILRDGRVWLAGGFFLGRVEVVARLCAEYRRFTEKFLAQNLTLADQSVLYAMYSTDNADRPTVGLQAFLPDARYNPWFSLCFIMRERWLTKNLPVPYLLVAANGSVAERG